MRRNVTIENNIGKMQKKIKTKHNKKQTSEQQKIQKIIKIKRIRETV